MFNSLLNNNLIKYKDYLINKGKKEFATILDQNQVIAYAKFQRMIMIDPDSNILNNISNPFFLGMGNPKSKILIFGQELAFDLDRDDPKSVELFFQEQFFHHSLLLKPQPAFFDPYYPNDYRKIKKHSHTWGIHSKWVAAFNEDDPKLYKKYLWNSPRVQKFEGHCFFTELYDTPSKNHQYSHTTSHRTNLFQSPEFKKFIRSFDYILIGCTSFYNLHKTLLKGFFGYDTKQINNVTEHNCYKKDGSPYIKGAMFNIEKQTFGIFNNQFSGAWKYEYIQEVAKQMKAIHHIL